MVGSYHLQTSEQVRIYLVLWMRAAGVWPWHHACQSQDSHQPLYPLAIDLIPFVTQVKFHLSATAKRVSCVFGVDLTQQG